MLRSQSRNRSQRQSLAIFETPNPRSAIHMSRDGTDPELLTSRFRDDASYRGLWRSISSARFGDQHLEIESSAGVRPEQWQCGPRTIFIDGLNCRPKSVAENRIAGVLHAVKFAHVTVVGWKVLDSFVREAFEVLLETGPAMTWEYVAYQLQRMPSQQS